MGAVSCKKSVMVCGTAGADLLFMVCLVGKAASPASPPGTADKSEVIEDISMLNNKEFDLWADGYDKAVGLSDEGNTYPFAGYKKVLGLIFQTIMESGNAVVLDIGFGTGTLTTKLYEHGCAIYGQDFSARMIALASEKMPNAHLYQGDFSKG